VICKSRSSSSLLGLCNSIGIAAQTTAPFQTPPGPPPGPTRITPSPPRQPPVQLPTFGSQFPNNPPRLPWEDGHICIVEIWSYATTPTSQKPSTKKRTVVFSTAVTTTYSIRTTITYDETMSVCEKGTPQTITTSTTRCS
jgi:hypothetical protein